MHYSSIDLTSNGSPQNTEASIEPEGPLCSQTRTTTCSTAQCQLYASLILDDLPELMRAITCTSATLVTPVCLHCSIKRGAVWLAASPLVCMSVCVCVCIFVYTDLHQGACDRQQGEGTQRIHHRKLPSRETARRAPTR